MPEGTKTNRLLDAFSSLESVPRQQLRMQKSKFRLALSEFQQRQNQQQKNTEIKDQLISDLKSNDQLKRISLLNQMVNDPSRNNTVDFFSLRDQLERELAEEEGMGIERISLDNGLSSFALKDADGNFIPLEEMIEQGGNVKHRIISNMLSLRDDPAVFDFVSKQLSDSQGANSGKKALAVRDLNNSTRIVFTDGSHADIPKNEPNQVIKVSDPLTGETKLIELSVDSNGERVAFELPLSERPVAPPDELKEFEVERSKKKIESSGDELKEFEEKFPIERTKKAIQRGREEEPNFNPTSTEDIINFVR